MVPSSPYQCLQRHQPLEGVTTLLRSFPTLLNQLNKSDETTALRVTSSVSKGGLQEPSSAEHRRPRTRLYESLQARGRCHPA
jgi:hypothetical protein